jgi:DNA-binding LacI/PurR family transcriptional regulator
LAAECLEQYDMATEITIRDVARKAGVSASTVSRVLNRAVTGVSISARTREKILTVCEELKFQPNIHAQRFFTQKSRTIGFVIPPKAKIKGVRYTFTDYNLGELLSGVEQTITAGGYRLTLLVADEDFVREKAHVRLIRDKSLDGLLLWGLEVDETYILDLKEESFPYVLLNGAIDKVEVNSVIADNRQGSFAVAAHLLEKGHRRIAYVQGPPNCSLSVDRYRGFEQAARKFRLPLRDVRIEAGDFTEESGYQAGKRLLSTKTPPTGILAANDMMAIGVMKAAKEAGLKIPQDIALTGGDGIPLAGYVDPGLTTFKVPMYEVGVRGVKRLLEIIENGRKEPICEILKTEMLIRRSTE